MPGSQPGVPAAAVVGKDGTVTYVNPATSIAYASLPAGSPGALMLQGPQAPAPAPAAVRQVFTLAPVPGQPGRLVKLPSGVMSVSPSGLAAPALAPAKGFTPNTDPPQGANLAIQQTASGVIVVKPLAMFGYPNADDAGPLNAAALQAGGGTQSGVQGTIELVPGAVYNLQSTWFVPHQAIVTGNMARLAVNGAASGIYMHDLTPGGGNNRVSNRAGVIRDLLIDGTNCTGTYITGQAAPTGVGLDIGDGWGYLLEHVYVENFTTAGQVGIRIGNDNYYTEKMRTVDIVVRNNAQCILMDQNTGGADDSHGYCDLEFTVYMLPDNTSQGVNQVGQGGLAVITGCNLYGGSLTLRGNHQSSNSTIPANIAVVAVTGNDGGGQPSIINQQRLDIRLEADGGHTNTSTKLYTTQAGNAIQDCYGIFSVTGAGGNPVAVAGQFVFSGIVPQANMQAIRTASTVWFSP